MDKKRQLMEQNLNAFLENYISDLLQYYAKNDEHFAALLAQKKELTAQLTKFGTPFFEYDDIQNTILHTIAELFYRNGFSDAIALHKKLK
ncbi:hypothetical protein [Clostridium sp. MD294]|uniref:hypothetical protein n=1 Tax=Clostridium sp. MD294 TaxID=97138 RepID=UPI0002CBA1CF|nr:hypothetical protein [Clostridium sp. MD294]NDO45916.1 hypothetical protein [Clostridium sp. MD294]USF30425.1 hypothetical protein C820_001866 [Clostridium sp. MD294]